MHAYVVLLQVVMICLALGIAAGAFQLYLWKGKDASGYKVKIMAFYMSAVYGMLSMAKTVLGEGELTLFESFNDIQMMTYAHYMALFLAFIIVAPVVMKFICSRGNGAEILSIWDSWICMLTAVAFVITGRIDNLLYIFIMIASALATLITVVFPKFSLMFGCTGEGYDRDTLVRKIKYILPMTAFYIATVVICVPGVIFLNNMREFPVSPFEYWKTMILAAMLYWVVITSASAYFLYEMQMKVFSRILFFITLGGYIQNMFMNGHMAQMDGTMQKWPVAVIAMNLAVWLVLSAAVFLADRVFYRDLHNVHRAVCIYICLIEIVSTAYMTVVSDDFKDVQSRYDNGGGELEKMAYDGMLELSANKNVVVFVLDWFDGQILGKLLEEDAGCLEKLEGFTCYTNASSLYAFTGMSLPYLLTGIELEKDMSEGEYCSYAYTNSHMISDINNAGFDTRIYTDSLYVDTGMMDSIANCSVVKPRADIFRSISVMSRCAQYQLVPVAFKNCFWYTTDSLYGMMTDECQDLGYTAYLYTQTSHLKKRQNA